MKPPPDVRLRRDHHPDLILERPTLLGEVSSEADAKPRWTEIRLWRTGEGSLVLEKVGRTTHPGEHDRCGAWILPDMAAVVDKLGHGRLSRELYEQVGYDTAERLR